MTSGDSASILPAAIELRNLFQIVEHQEDYEWEYFREGVDIHRLYGDGITGPTAALLRYREAAPIPSHVHEGYEHILVLSGSQQDQEGKISAGTLRIHAPGSTHIGMAEPGCIILAIYEKPVRFFQ